MPTPNACTSCLMPFHKDPGHRENPNYCSYCFHDGKLAYEGSDLKTFQQVCYQSMLSHGTNKWLAKLYTFMIRFAPRWRQK